MDIERFVGLVLKSYHRQAGLTAGTRRTEVYHWQHMLYCKCQNMGFAGFVSFNVHHVYKIMHLRSSPHPACQTEEKSKMLL